MIKSFLKILLSLILLSFVLVALVGLNAGMVMDDEGKMSNCPFDEGSSSMCDMNPFDHIMRWEQTFTASVHSYFEQIFNLLLIWGLIVVGIFAFKHIISIYYMRQDQGYYFDPLNIISNAVIFNISNGILRLRL